MGGVQYHGGYLEYCGVFNTVVDIMINVGDILSTLGVLSTMEGYHEYCGVILSTVGDVQYCGDIMMHVGIS